MPVSLRMAPKVNFPLMNFNFNLRETSFFQFLRWERYSIFRYTKLLQSIFFFFFFFFFSLFILGFLTELFPLEIYSKFFGLALVFLSLAIAFWILDSFFHSKIKNPQLKASLSEVIEKPSQFNLARFLSFDVARAVFKTINFSKSKKLSQIPSIPLLYFFLQDNPDLHFIFYRATISPETLKQELKNYLIASRGEKFEETYSAEFQNIILDALKRAGEKGKKRIEIGDILVSLSSQDPFLKEVLIKNNLKAEDIENLTWWLSVLRERREKLRKFWSSENLMRKGSIAKDWAAGYTITLDKYAIDWTEIIKKRGFEEIIGHKEALAQAERILARSEINNALLVGDPGTGRKSIIQDLASRILYGQSLPELNYKRVVELDLISLLSETTNIEEVEIILDKIFNEVIVAGNIVLVIDRSE